MLYPILIFILFFYIDSISLFSVEFEGQWPHISTQRDRRPGSTEGTSHSRGTDSLFCLLNLVRHELVLRDVTVWKCLIKIIMVISIISCQQVLQLFSVNSAVKAVLRLRTCSLGYYLEQRWKQNASQNLQRYIYIIHIYICIIPSAFLKPPSFSALFSFKTKLRTWDCYWELCFMLDSIIYRGNQIRFYW